MPFSIGLGHHRDIFDLDDAADFDFQRIEESQDVRVLAAAFPAPRDAHLHLSG